MNKAAHRGFRADINGLRAWAVLAVILFHFKVRGFDGGYVGVDIFFVISGFLMTGIIARALQGGAADAPLAFLWNFFLARGKRIWPALIVMCAALFIVGWLVMSPEEFAAYGEQARSAVLFWSNMKFWRETGYFTGNAHGIWLMHTWSLSVEWQFYMLLPVAMLLTWKILPSPRALLALLIAGGLLSLGLCLYVAANKPGTAFFLLPFRAWEMVAGGVVALTAVRPPRSAALRHGLEIGGLALIAYAVLAFGHLVWPQWRALVPVLGTVMVLLAAKENSVLTNWTPLRWIGERSYSMYLWHWPLVVGVYHFGDRRNLLLTAGCVALTFVLGHLSYVLVETRMRRPLDTMPRGAGSAALAAACAAIVLPGTMIAYLGGVPARLSTDAQRMFAVATEKDDAFPGCRIMEHGNDNGCLSGGSTPGVIVLGDSHAAALFGAVQSALPRPDMGAVRWTMSGCPSMLNLHSSNDPSFHCDQFMAWVMRRIETVPASVPVLIINRSSLYMQGPNEDDADEDVTAPDFYFRLHYAARSPAFYREVRQNMIDTACAIAKHHKVYMMRPVAEMRIHVPNALGHAMVLGRHKTISMPMAEYTRRHALVWEAQDAARDQCGVTILDPLPYLCGKQGCDAVVNQRSMYFDDDHLSRYGAGFLKPMFSTMFAPRRVDEL